MSEELKDQTQETKEEESPKKTLSKSQLAELIREQVGGALGELKKEKEFAYSPFMVAKRENVDDLPEGPKEKGAGASRMVRALAFGGGNPEKSLWFARKAWDDRLGHRVERALAAGDFTAGGFLVPEDMAQDIIDLLRPRTAVRAAGAQTLPMPRGTMALPKQTSDITASYVGENKVISKTEPVGGQIELTAKKLAAIVPISNDLLDFNAPGLAADDFVRNSLVQRISVREDAAFIRDDDTGGTPKGMRFWAQSANVTSSNGTSSANIEADFTDLLEDLEGNNVPLDGAAWFMSSRSKNALVNLRDSNGNLVFPTVRNERPTIHGLPVWVTNNIPNNLGGGSATEIYLAHMPSVIIGEAGGMEITVSNEASYTDSGTLQSAFDRDQTAVRAVLRHDLAVVHTEAVAVKTSVTWT